MLQGEVPAPKLDRIGRRRNPVNTGAKGGRIERVVVEFLRSHGYHVYTPDKLSRSAFDRVASRTYCTVHRDPAPCKIPTIPELTRDQQEPGGIEQCRFVCDERWIQVKGNDWCMQPSRGDLAKVVKSNKPPEHASREFFRHMDHKNEKFDPLLHLAARQILPDGTWYKIALLPEWGTNELPGCI